MATQYRSRMVAAIHETVEGLHAAGPVDKRTMRSYDETCLTRAEPNSATESPARQQQGGAIKRQARPVTPK